MWPRFLEEQEGFLWSKEDGVDWAEALCRKVWIKCLIYRSDDDFSQIWVSEYLSSPVEGLPKAQAEGGDEGQVWGWPVDVEVISQKSPEPEGHSKASQPRCISGSTSTPSCFSHLFWFWQNSLLSLRVSYTQPGAKMAAEKLWFLMASRACRQSEPCREETFLTDNSPHHVATANYLICFKLSSHHISSGKHINPDVNIRQAALELGVVLHPLQVLHCPVVVGEESIASIKKHSVVEDWKSSKILTGQRNVYTIIFNHQVNKPDWKLSSEKNTSSPTEADMCWMKRSLKYLKTKIILKKWLK